MRGLPCLLGVTFGTGSLLFAVALGLGAASLSRPGFLQALNWIGGAFLLWLAYRIATAPPDDLDARRKPVGFGAAAALQWVNPKCWLVSTSAASTYLAAESGSALAQSVTFGLLFVLAAMPACSVWLAFGSVMRRILKTPRASRIFNLSMGTLLAGSVALILV